MNVVVWQQIRRNTPAAAETPANTRGPALADSLMAALGWLGGSLPRRTKSILRFASVGNVYQPVWY